MCRNTRDPVDNATYVIAGYHLTVAVPHTKGADHGRAYHVRRIGRPQDVHKKMINVALLRPWTRDPVTWDVPNEPEAVRRFTRKLARLTDGPVACCYEAGPCGYVL